MRLLPFQGLTPAVDPSAFVADDASLIGDVTVAAGASVWFGAVMRGDTDHLELGDYGFHPQQRPVLVWPSQHTAEHPPRDVVGLDLQADNLDSPVHGRL